MTSLAARTIRSTLIGAIAIAALILVPAGTFDYWRAWMFVAVFQGSSIALGVYLAIHDPALLARRMRVGPTAETEKSQKIIMVLAMVGFAALLVIPALDWRFGWSSVPWPLSLAGDGLIALAFVFIFFVFRANSYGASTIQVAEGQQVVSTGPYAWVRHPMYAGVIVMLIGVPPALGSWWGLLVVAFLLPVLIWRLLDEERFLKRHLPGYTQYTQDVRYRLVPRIW
jgi:protein-S-isoprenylcysteine O-methyltransferase Ste14